MGRMKDIVIFADEHGYDEDDVKDFAYEWVPVVETDRPLWAVLNSYRVMDERDIHDGDTEAFMDYLPLCQWDVEEAGATFKDRYHGQWESLEEYARQSLDDTGFMELRTERTRAFREDVWLSYRDVLRFCRENKLQKPPIDVAAWERHYSISRNGHVFQAAA